MSARNLGLRNFWPFGHDVHVAVDEAIAVCRREPEGALTDRSPQGAERVQD